MCNCQVTNCPCKGIPLYVENDINQIVDIQLDENNKLIITMSNGAQFTTAPLTINAETFAENLIYYSTDLSDLASFSITDYVLTNVGDQYLVDFDMILKIGEEFKILYEGDTIYSWTPETTVNQDLYVKGTLTIGLSDMDEIMVNGAMDITYASDVNIKDRVIIKKNTHSITHGTFVTFTLSQLGSTIKSVNVNLIKRKV